MILRKIVLILIGMCLSFAVHAQTIAISAIGSKPPNTAFAASGSLGSYGSAPTLQYNVNGAAWAALPGGASVSNTAFTFNVPAQTTSASSTLNVRDASNPSITASAQFAITGGSQTPSGFYTTVPNVVITDSCNEAFSFTLATGNGQVIQNGITDTITHNVTEIAYVGGRFYQLGTGAWYVKTCAADTYTLFGTTSPLPGLEGIVVNNIAQQQAGVPIAVSGAVAGAVVQPILQYQINAGPLLGIAYSTINGPFSFNTAGQPQSAVDTITILDALTGVNATSNQFCVGPAATGGRPVLLIFGVNKSYPFVSDHAEF